MHTEGKLSEKLNLLRYDTEVRSACFYGTYDVSSDFRYDKIAQDKRDVNCITKGKFQWNRITSGTRCTGSP